MSTELCRDRSSFVLTVADLRKSFTSPSGERLEVLRGIDLSARSGEMIAVTGASGAGKSTLLHLLGFLDQPDHGTISWDQASVVGTSNLELARFRQRNIGFIFQFHHLLGDLTAAENVALPLLIARFSPRDARVRARQALESLGMSDKANYPTGQLSGGEQQRVAFARALITNPALVLADEPTGNLDAALGDELSTMLRNYCGDQNALVIVATHNRGLARLCDRILIIHNGRLHANQTQAHFVEASEYEAAEGAL